MLLHEGTNCTVTKEDSKVYKTLKTTIALTHSQAEILEDLIYKYLAKLLPYINIPQTKCYIQTEEQDTIIIKLEQDFCGDNYIQMYNTRNIRKLDIFRRRTLEIIKGLSEDLYIDVHPLNFVINSVNEIYFVDLIPPILSMNPSQAFLKDMFPIFKHKDIDQLNRRIYRYSKKYGRIEKFKYYEDIILNRLAESNNGTYNL